MRPELTRDLEWFEAEAEAYAADYRDKLNTLDAAGMLRAIQRHERIDQVAGRIMSFAGLRYYQQTTDGGRAKFMSDMQDRLTSASTQLVFLQTSNSTGSKTPRSMRCMFQNPDLARYKPNLDPAARLQAAPAVGRDGAVPGRHLARRRKRVEQALRRDGGGGWNSTSANERPTTWRAWPRWATARTAACARMPAREMSRVVGENTKTFARVHNTLAKMKEIEDRWPQPAHAASLSPSGQPRGNPKSSKPCATPWSPPIRACRTAITRSKPSGWGSTS